MKIKESFLSIYVSFFVSCILTNFIIKYYYRLQLKRKRFVIQCWKRVRIHQTILCIFLKTDSFYLLEMNQICLFYIFHDSYLTFQIGFVKWWWFGIKHKLLYTACFQVFELLWNILYDIFICKWPIFYHFYLI